MADGAIRVGIVGAGAIIRSRNLRGLRAMPGVEMVSVVNRSRESSERAAEEMEIPQVYDNWVELVRQVPDFRGSSRAPVIEAAGGIEAYLALRAAMDHYNDAFHLRSQGYLDNETWEVLESVVRPLFQDSRVQTIWKARPGRFYPGFRQYIDALMPSEESND